MIPLTAAVQSSFHAKPQPHTIGAPVIRTSSARFVAAGAVPVHSDLGRTADPVALYSLPSATCFPACLHSETTHLGYSHPATRTHAPALSFALTHPLPSVTPDGRGMVGMGSREPVCVRVGKSEICARRYDGDGPIAVGGQTPCEETWSALMLGEGTPPVAAEG